MPELSGSKMLVLAIEDLRKEKQKHEQQAENNRLQAIECGELITNLSNRCRYCGQFIHPYHPDKQKPTPMEAHGTEYHLEELEAELESTKNQA